MFGELVDRVPLTWEEQLMGGRKEIALLPSDVIAQGADELASGRFPVGRFRSSEQGVDLLVVFLEHGDVGGGDAGVFEFREDPVLLAKCKGAEDIVQSCEQRTRRSRVVVVGVALQFCQHLEHRHVLDRQLGDRFVFAATAVVTHRQPARRRVATSVQPGPRRSRTNQP